MARSRASGRGAPGLRAALLLAATAGLGAVGASARGDGTPPAGGTGKALDAFFRGALVGLDGTKVRLRYDFSTAEQRKDWIDGVPWPIAKDASDAVVIADGRLAVRGTVGARHVADWDEVSVTCRMVPDGTKDIGAYLGTPDSATDYATFSIGETYFHNWDKKTGGETGMMKFEKGFSAVKGGGYVGFRYLASRMPVNPVVPGKASLFAFGRRGDELWMNVDDLKLDSKEPAPRLRNLQPGFYSIHSSVTVDDVVLEGTLSPRWLADHEVALKADKPIVAETGGAQGVDPAVVAAAADYASGKASVQRLIDILQEGSRSDPDRQAAADAIKAGPKKALPALIDLLYNPDLKVRTVGIDIVKAMTGKNYGYDPKASEKARAAAVARFRKDLDEHPN
jgi:hypothetical protein